MEQTRNCGNNGFDMYNIGDRCEYVQYAIEIERTGYRGALRVGGRRRHRDPARSRRVRGR